MNQPLPKEKYLIIHPTENGEEMKFSFVLTLDRVIKKDVAQRLDETLGKLDGIDTIQPHGKYTLFATIARTFDPDEVIAELKRLLEQDVLTSIVRPKLLT